MDFTRQLTHGTVGQYHSGHPTLWRLLHDYVTHHSVDAQLVWMKAVES